MQVHRHAAEYQGKEGGRITKDKDEAERHDAEERARKAREDAATKARFKAGQAGPATFKLDFGGRAPIKPIVHK